MQRPLARANSNKSPTAWETGGATEEDLSPHAVGYLSDTVKRQKTIKRKMFDYRSKH
jgi:hypothetical protein